jgi:hypothetical protein
METRFQPRLQETPANQEDHPRWQVQCPRDLLFS